jgi:predicted phosphodiesterase
VKTAIISDIHGNFTALGAIDEALRREAPDAVIVGGDLVGGGGRLAEIIDLIRERGWPAVAGNTDEMLWQPERIDALEARLPTMKKQWDMIRDDIAIAHRSIGSDRLAWLRGLPSMWKGPGLAVVHASPGDKWTSPAANATDDELARVYGPVGSPTVVFGHLHVPFICHVGALTVANSGSVGMPYDGDPRAAFLVIENGEPTVQRVAYDIEHEINDRKTSGYPHVDWIGAVLRKGEV